MNNQCPSESVYDTCAYRNCRNGRFSTGAHLFRFPLSTDARYKIWIRNSGKFLRFSYIYFYILWMYVVFMGVCVNLNVSHFN